MVTHSTSRGARQNSCEGPSVRLESASWSVVQFIGCQLFVSPFKHLPASIILCKSLQWPLTSFEVETTLLRDAVRCSCMASQQHADLHRHLLAAARTSVHALPFSCISHHGPVGLCKYTFKQPAGELAFSRCLGKRVSLTRLNQSLAA